MKKHKFAKVPENYQSDEIKWLRLIDNTSEKQGVPVLLYSSLSDHCLYDQWFERLEEAYSYAKEDYGISQDDWIRYDEVKKMGFKIIDEE